MIRKNRTKLAKMDITLYKEFKDIAAKRFASGLDKRYSPPTVQRKAIRHSAWQTIRKDLEIAEFIKDENAQMQPFNIFVWMIVAFVAVVFFGGLIYVTGLLNDTLLEVGANNEGNAGMPGYTNLTHAANVTFGQVNNSIQALRMVAITLIFSQILLFIILNSFVRTHPALFFVYVLIVFLAVMFAAPLSNAYEELLTSQIYDGLLQSFTGANFILLNLPLITLFVGIFGGIFMFINIIRAGNESAL